MAETNDYHAAELSAFVAEFEPEFPPVVDPLVQRVYDLAKQRQQELDDDPFMPKERQSEIVSELDQEWPHLQSMTLVSGLVRIYDYDVRPKDEDDPTRGLSATVKTDEHGRQLLRALPVENYYLLSRGFVVEHEPLLVGGEYLGDRPHLYMLFEGSLPLTTGGDAPQIWTNMPSFAEPGAVTISSSIESIDYLRSRCEAYLPHLAREVAKVEALGERASLADRLSALRDIAITFRENTWLRDEIGALSRYIKAAVRAESEPLPILALAKSGANFYEDIFDDNDVMTTNQMIIKGTCSSTSPDLMIVEHVNLLNKVPTNPIHQQIVAASPRYDYGIALSVRLLGTNPEDDVTGMVYLHDLISIQDTRSILVEKVNDDQA